MEIQIAIWTPDDEPIAQSDRGNPILVVMIK
jgi:hypothetical protein